MGDVGAEALNLSVIEAAAPNLRPIEVEMEVRVAGIDEGMIAADR